MQYVIRYFNIISDNNKSQFTRLLCSTTKVSEITPVEIPGEKKHKKGLCHMVIGLLKGEKGTLQNLVIYGHNDRQFDV